MRCRGGTERGVSLLWWMGEGVVESDSHGEDECQRERHNRSFRAVVFFLWVIAAGSKKSVVQETIRSVAKTFQPDRTHP